MVDRLQGLDDTKPDKVKIQQRIGQIVNRKNQRSILVEVHSILKDIQDEDKKQLDELFNSYQKAYSIMENSYACLVSAYYDVTIDISILQKNLVDYTHNSNTLITARTAYRSRLRYIKQNC